MRRRFILVTSVMIVVACPLPARAQIWCGPWVNEIECEKTNYSNYQAMLTQMREIADQRAQAMAAIKQARDRFWATYPNKPGADKARADFAYWLGVKDFYYLRENLKAPVTIDGRGRPTSTAAANVLDTFGGAEKIDNGIRDVALPEFEAWVNAVRAKLFEGHTSNSTDDAFMQGLLATWIGQKLSDAMAANTKLYDAYTAERDWWEFDHVNRAPDGFDTPATYGVYLYARFRHVPLPKASANYKKMTDLLGVQRVEAAARRVMDAPKGEDGGLVVTVDASKKGPGGGDMIDYDKPAPDEVIGAYADPVQAMELLSARDDDRRYLLYLLHNHAPDLRHVDQTTTWTFADSAYKRLVLAFGEPEVLQAAHAVRLAPKRLYSGGVMTVKDLGAKRTEPIETFQDVLATKDPRGYVRAALVFAKDLDTPAAVDSAYTAYVAAKGEQAVLDAARRRAADRSQLTYSGELESIDAEIASPTVTVVRPKGPQKESPAYLTWKAFAPGASASYIDRTLVQRPQQHEFASGAVNARSRYLLQSIDADRVSLDMTIIAYDNPDPRTPSVSGSAHPPRDSEVAYASQTDATPSASEVARPEIPLQSGDETIEIHGKKIATHWQAAQSSIVSRPGCGPIILTTWTSDEVPGGLVRKTLDMACSYGRSVRETLLESFQATGLPTRVQPIQPVAGTAPILPLHVDPSLPGQGAQRGAPIAAPAATSAPAPGTRGTGVDRGARLPQASAPSGAAQTIPEGTVITVMTSGAITATSHAGDTFRGTIVQPVLANGAPILPYGTQVTLQVAPAGDGLAVVLTGIVMNSRTIAASSAAADLDAQTAARNAAIEQASAANQNAARRQAALDARMIVVKGPRLNLPSGSRLVVTLSAPVTIDR